MFQAGEAEEYRGKDVCVGSKVKKREKLELVHWLRHRQRGLAVGCYTCLERCWRTSWLSFPVCVVNKGFPLTTVFFEGNAGRWNWCPIRRKEGLRPTSCLNAQVIEIRMLASESRKHGRQSRVRSAVTSTKIRDSAKTLNVPAAFVIHSRFTPITSTGFPSGGSHRLWYFCAVLESPIFRIYSIPIHDSWFTIVVTFMSYEIVIFKDRMETAPAKVDSYSSTTNLYALTERAFL